MSTSEKESEASGRPQGLALDPGNMTRRLPPRKLGKSIFNYCLYTAGLIVILLASFVVWTLSKYIAQYIEEFRHPHKAFYHNSSHPIDHTQVVRPIFDKHAVFDLSATVWVQLEPGHEVAVFDGIVMTGLTIESVRSTVVSVTIPTRPFNVSHVPKNLVRAAYTVIPRKSALNLYNTNEYATYLMSVYKEPPFAPQMRAENKIGDGWTIQEDKLVHNSGVSQYLDVIIKTNAECPRRSYEVPQLEATETLEESVTSAVPELGGQWEQFLSDAELRENYTDHPMIITRSWVMMTLDNNVYQRKGFETMQELLITRLAHMDMEMHRKTRTYSSTGSYEHMIGFSPKDGDDADLLPPDNLTEWFYGPYLSTSGISAGNKHMEDIPVERERCEGVLGVGSLLENETFTFDWTITFSAVPPLKFFFADISIESLALIFSFDDRGLSLTDLHNRDEIMEFTNALLGHQWDPLGRPLRRAGYVVVATMVWACTLLLRAHYWFTLSSTAGIALLPVFVADLVHLAVSAYQFAISESKIWDALAFLVDLGNWLLFLRLWKLLRLYRGWSSNGRGWIPMIRRRSPDRGERLTQRQSKIVLSQIPVLLVYPVVFGLFIWREPMTYALMEWGKTGGHKVKEDYDTFVNWTSWTLSSLTWSLSQTGEIIQLIMNQRLGTFSSMHRLEAHFTALSAVLELVAVFPFVIGHWDAYRMLTLWGILVAGLRMVWSYQAARLPKMSQKYPEEEE